MMDTKEIVSDKDIECSMKHWGFTNRTIDEGRLALLELISKAGAGYYNSHTEENFLTCFGLMRQDRTPNKRGLKFIMSMVYASSNQRPVAYKLMQKHRL